MMQPRMNILLRSISQPQLIRTFNIPRQTLLRSRHFPPSHVVPLCCPITTSTIVGLSIVGLSLVTVRALLLLRMAIRESTIANRNEKAEDIEAKLASEEKQIDDRNIRDARLVSRVALRNIQRMTEAHWKRKASDRELPPSLKAVDASDIVVLNAIWKRELAHGFWMDHEEACAIYAMVHGKDSAGKASLYLSEMASRMRFAALEPHAQEVASGSPVNLILLRRRISHLLLNELYPYEVFVRLCFIRTFCLWNWQESCDICDVQILCDGCAGLREKGGNAKGPTRSNHSSDYARLSFKISLDISLVCLVSPRAKGTGTEDRFPNCDILGLLSCL